MSHTDTWLTGQILRYGKTGNTISGKIGWSLPIWVRTATGDRDTGVPVNRGGGAMSYTADIGTIESVLDETTTDFFSH